MTFERWQRVSELPLIIAAVVFLVAYSVQVIANPASNLGAILDDVIWFTWVVFVIDYIACLALSPNRWQWFSTHLFDLATVVLPMLRPLRVLRVVTLLTVLQRTTGRALRGRIVIYTAGATTLLIYVAALAVLDAERGAGGDITTFPDAIWWAFTTITTVGYGDLAPSTLQGRAIAVGLMLGGIALLGVVTATLASWIVEKVANDAGSRQAATVAHIETLRAEIAELKTMLQNTPAEMGGAYHRSGSDRGSGSDRRIEPDP